MTNPNAHDIKVLNGLIETTLDSADGYREAAEQTQDPHYRTLFERRAGERAGSGASRPSLVPASHAGPRGGTAPGLTPAAPRCRGPA